MKRAINSGYIFVSMIHFARLVTKVITRRNNHRTFLCSVATALWRTTKAIYYQIKSKLKLLTRFIFAGWGGIPCCHNMPNGDYLCHMSPSRCVPTGFSTAWRDVYCPGTVTRRGTAQKNQVFCQRIFRQDAFSGWTATELSRTSTGNDAQIIVMHVRQPLEVQAKNTILAFGTAHEYSNTYNDHGTKMESFEWSSIISHGSLFQLQAIPYCPHLSMCMTLSFFKSRSPEIFHE